MKKNVIFKVNKYITLKLEEGVTKIYVGGESFIHCKKLLLHIPKQNVEHYNEIDSIDDIVYHISWEGIRDDKYSKITPEQEFVGHCSKLQAWAEHNYDTRLLHSNLAFPLLKKLVEVGDLAAKRVFREEIVTRFIDGDNIVRYYLITVGYLKFLDIEAIKLIVDKMGYDNVPVILLLKLNENGDNKAEEALMEDHKFYTEFKQYFIDLIKQETNLTETEIDQQIKKSIFRGYQPEVDVMELSFLVYDLGLSEKFRKSKKEKEWKLLCYKRALRRIIKNRILRVEYSTLPVVKRTRLIQFLIENKIDYSEQYFNHWSYERYISALDDDYLAHRVHFTFN